jgi:hypothetical protein
LSGGPLSSSSLDIARIAYVFSRVGVGIVQRRYPLMLRQAGSGHMIVASESVDAKVTDFTRTDCIDWCSEYRRVHLCGRKIRLFLMHRECVFGQGGCGRQATQRLYEQSIERGGSGKNLGSLVERAEFSQAGS